MADIREVSSGEERNPVSARYFERSDPDVSDRALPPPVLSGGEATGASDAETQRIRELAMAALQRESAAMSLRRQREPSSSEGSARRPKRRPGSERSSSVSLPLTPQVPDLGALLQDESFLEDAPMQETPEERSREWQLFTTPSEAGSTPGSAELPSAVQGLHGCLGYVAGSRSLLQRRV